MLGLGNLGGASSILNKYALAGPGVDLGYALPFPQAPQIDLRSFAILAVLGQFSGLRLFFLLSFGAFYLPLSEFRLAFDNRFLLRRGGATG